MNIRRPVIRPYFGLGLILALLLLGRAHADPNTLIAQGDYAAAYEEAVTHKNAQSQVLAAQAASSQATYLETNQQGRENWLKRAEAAAQEAIKLDPKDAQAYFELARAKGLLARYQGILQNLGLAPELKKLFDKTLELNPENPDALVALAEWNLELWQHGVGWLYGGDKSRVILLFEKALKLAPKQVNLHVEYATGLEQLGKHKEAKQQLKEALALPAQDAADGFEQARARRLLAAWESQ
jgi:tetratricopeptide (TPR) repeat protein